MAIECTWVRAGSGFSQAGDRDLRVRYGLFHGLEACGSPCCIICVEGVYEFARAAMEKYHRPGGLKKWNFISPQFWRPKVQEQGGSRFTFFWSLFLRLAGGLPS